MDTMWIWGVIGLLLLAIEMATGTFYVLWFGVAALFVALGVGLIPTMPIAIQFLIYAILSLCSLAIWRLYYKKTSINSRIGQAQGEEIGRIGIVIKPTSPTKNGKITFTQGLMGSRTWDACSDEAIDAGSEATVIAVEGNLLRIQTK